LAERSTGLLCVGDSVANREPPLVLSIPLPSELARAYGIESTRGPFACFIQYRGLINERENIKKAAEICGISYGMFMRCILNDAATEIINAMRPDNNNDGKDDGTATTRVDT
jgi:hypothetical protein